MPKNLPVPAERKPRNYRNKAYYLLLRYVDFRLMREVYLSELHERSADRLSLGTYATYNLVAHGLN
jgi:hypothetical protein